MSDVFRRARTQGGSKLFTARSDSQYQGQGGLETLFGQAMPLLLIRTDPRALCVCKSQSGSGQDLCARCFGTGKVVQSLDRIGAHINRSNPNPAAPAGVMGLEFSDNKKIYTGRWVKPSQGDLILEVGWDVPNTQVYQKGKVQTVDNVYQVRQINYVGFREVSYCSIFTVFANTEKPKIEDLLLFSRVLPILKNCLAE